jgi:capsule polysaccharide export protein KpsE/RkpR
VNPHVAKRVRPEEPEKVEGSYTPSPITDNGDYASEHDVSSADLLLGLWRERRFVAKAFAYGLLLAAIVSLLIPPKYESTTRIMPPEKGGIGGLAAMLATVGGGDDKSGAGSLVGGLMSDALGVKSSGAVFIGVLKSRSVKDSLIDQFDLRKVYRVKYMEDAREELGDRTTIDEDRKSGIISITVEDRSPQRAMQMARAYSDSLGRLTTELNTSAAHRERVFLEERLKQVKGELDTASKDLSDFSSKNLTLDVKEQGKAMVTGAATLEGQLIATESQLSGLQQIYTPNNVRVRSLQARVDQLRSKLGELRGNGAGGPDDSGDFGVSIAKLPKLGLTYYDLFRRAKIEETVFEILTKQYELAKIEEAKEVPSIKVLDVAQVPELKSSPKRVLITLIGGFLAAILASSYMMASLRLRSVSASHPLSLFGLEMREGVAADVDLVRTKMPPTILRMASAVRTKISGRNGPSRETD